MAKDITKIDRNLAVAGIDAPDCVFHDVRKPPFKIYGLYNPETLEGATVNIESTCQKILGKLKIRIELKKK